MLFLDRHNYSTEYSRIIIISSIFQVQEKSLDEFSFLIFSHVTSKHSGDYTCVASNSAAEVNHTARLAVKGRASICAFISNIYIKNPVVHLNDILDYLCFSGSVLGIWASRRISSFRNSDFGALFYQRLSWAKGFMAQRSWWVQPETALKLY